MPFKFYGRTVLEAGMRPHQIEVLPPGLDDDFGFAARAEPLKAEAFVAELPVEALVGAILPGLTGIDQSDLDVFLDDPFEDRLADELWAVVSTE